MGLNDQETWAQVDVVATRALRDHLSEEPGMTEDLLEQAAAGVADEMVSSFEVREQGPRTSGTGRRWGRRRER